MIHCSLHKQAAKARGLRLRAAPFDLINPKPAVAIFQVVRLLTTTLQFATIAVVNQGPQNLGQRWTEVFANSIPALWTTNLKRGIKGIG